MYLEHKNCYSGLPTYRKNNLFSVSSKFCHSMNTKYPSICNEENFFLIIDLIKVVQLKF